MSEDFKRIPQQLTITSLLTGWQCTLHNDINTVTYTVTGFT